MKVKFATYPIQEWILDEDTGFLSEPELNIKAIAQDIKFILATERNMYPIMGSNFGIELLDLVGKDEQYIRAQIKSRIADALSVDDRIIKISEFAFKKTDSNSLSVSFNVKTVLGDVPMTTTIVS